LLTKKANRAVRETVRVKCPLEWMCVFSLGVAIPF
jgi:hypothetical protein